MSACHLTPRRVLAVALLAACGVASNAAPAVADANPSQFALGIKLNAQLLPVLHATEVVGFAEDGWEWDYVTKGYFKVGGKTVARLPTFSGHANRTREHLRLTIKRSTRSTIRAAAKRRGTRRVILTLVHRLTLAAGPSGVTPGTTRTVTQNAYLTVPRN
jgi:hypothetical protein